MTRLEALESQIERDLVDVGVALGEIKGEKLYKPLTWETYCRERWGWTGEWCNRRIRAANARRAIIASKPETASGLGVLGLKSIDALASYDRGASSPQPHAAAPASRGTPPAVVTALQQLHKAMQETPIEDVVAWAGNSRRLAMQWASVRSYMDDVFEARGDAVPPVLRVLTGQGA